MTTLPSSFVTFKIVVTYNLSHDFCNTSKFTEGEGDYKVDAQALFKNKYSQKFKQSSKHVTAHEMVKYKPRTQHRCPVSGQRDADPHSHNKLLPSAWTGQKQNQAPSLRNWPDFCNPPKVHSDKIPPVWSLPPRSVPVQSWPGKHQLRLSQHRPLRHCNPRRTPKSHSKVKFSPSIIYQQGEEGKASANTQAASIKKGPLRTKQQSPTSRPAPRIIFFSTYFLLKGPLNSHYNLESPG